MNERVEAIIKLDALYGEIVLDREGDFEKRLAILERAMKQTMIVVAASLVYSVKEL